MHYVSWFHIISTNQVDLVVTLAELYSAELSRASPYKIRRKDTKHVLILFSNLISKLTSFWNPKYPPGIRVALKSIRAVSLHGVNCPTQPLEFSRSVLPHYIYLSAIIMLDSCFISA